MPVRNLGLLFGCVMALHACNDAAPSNDEAPAKTRAADTETEVMPPPVETSAELDDAPEETETIRQAHSHVHGLAQLAIVLEGSALTLELASPLYNLIGFEHVPETDEQADAVKKAETLLNKPGQLFQPNASADCTAETGDLDIHLIKGWDSDAHEHDEHEGEHDHDDEHDHGEHEHEGHEDDHDEEHGHDDDHADHGNHKDALINYTFTCQSPEKLTQFDTSLMTEFPNITELEVVYLGPDSQEVFTLTPTNTRVTLGK